MKSLSNRARVARPLVVSALALLACWPTAAVAQRYKADTVDAKLSKNSVLARRYAKTGSGDAQEFRDYMEKAFFPAMTQPTPEALGELEKSQGELFKNYLYETSGATQKYVHDQALAFAVRVLRDRGYHPSVRYNALLVLGKLDDKYPQGDEPPTPSAKANDLLCALINGAVKNPRSPNYELVGSLVGLERHANLLAKLPTNQQRNTAKTLYGVLTIDQLAGEFAPGVRDWVFLRAASAASNLGALNSKGAISMGLAKRAGDESLELSTRAAILAELAKLGGKPGQFKPEPIVEAVVAVAVAVAKEEAEVAEEFEKLNIAGGQAFFAPRGKLARRITQGPEREPVLMREGLLAVLSDVRDAAKAVKAITPEDKQEPLATIETAYGEAIRVASDKGSIDLDVTEAVRKMAAVVEPLGKAEDEPLAKSE